MITCVKIYFFAFFRGCQISTNVLLVSIIVMLMLTVPTPTAPIPVSVKLVTKVMDARAQISTNARLVAISVMLMPAVPTPTAPIPASVNLVTMVMDAQPCENGVAIAIGMQNKTIPDQYITASSSYYAKPYNLKARLGLSAGWSTGARDQNQWLQVNVGKIAKIVRIATQGRQDRYEWVKNYSLSSSLNGSSFEVYDGKRNFSANSDSNTVVAHLLKPVITARYIRVHPITWYRSISMRMELYECKNETCSYALGMQSGVVKDAQLTASSSLDSSHPPSAARLERQDRSSHAWRSKYYHDKQWLQIEFTKVKQINGVATQGHLSRWVTEYSLQYSNTSDKFAVYTVDGNTTTIFVGNVNVDSIVYNAIEPPITAKLIRFLPRKWHSSISLRMELYGCPYMD
ncbi:hypothetical protein QZH41_018309 [Actinostola sp. cb2023]|nr:hypothetical protein QZH41_018309 [Actinostola sp. cb2023]